MPYPREFWELNFHKSSNELSREHGRDAGNWRRDIRRAKEDYPDLWGGLPRDKTTRGIAVFDLHHPHHTKKLWKNIMRFAADFEPDVFVFGGDNMNMDAVDHWKNDKGKKRPMEGLRLKSEYADFQSEILTPLDDVLGDGCRRIFHLGNHEDWVEQAIDQNPQGEGYWEIGNNLDLSKWEVYEYGKSSEVGKLHFIHGVYCLQHNAYKTVTVYHRNIVYGHGHTYQTHTEVTPLDSDPHTATQLPCACDMNPSYARNKPNAWLNGFGVFYVRPDGSFNLYPIIAVDGSFTAPDGTTY